MNPFIVTVAAVVIVLLVAGLIFGGYWWARPSYYSFIPDRRVDVERYKARTPAGPAYITRVLDERGEGFRIETRFRRRPGHENTTVTVGRSGVIARDTLRRLAEAHLSDSAAPRR